MAKTTTDGRPTRKCRADCLDGKQWGDCDCNCGGNCHSLGTCDPELHRFDARGSFRTVDFDRLHEARTKGATR